MTYPVGSAPDGAYVVGGNFGQDVTEASAKAIMTGKTKTAFGNAQDQHKINVGNPLTSLFGSVGQLFNDTAANHDLIQVQGQQLADLEDFVGTGTTTPMYASTGGRDLVTFPDTMMQPIIVNPTVTHRHGGNDNGTSFTSFASTGLEYGPPVFNQAKNTVDFGFLRGGRDTDTPLEVIRVITGADTSIFDIDAWYLGIYVLRTSDNVMVKLWDSGNIKNVLTGQRQRYHIATGMTQSATNDQVLAIASLQIAPGAIQKPRGLGCIFQTGISEQTGTIPYARHAYVVGQTSLPGGVAINGGFFNWDNTKLMWAAVGESAT